MSGRLVDDRNVPGSCVLRSPSKVCRAFGYASLIQILGLTGVVVAAAVDIESIMATGPILSFTGLIVALSWRFCGSVLLGAFGLSTPAMSVFLMLLINVLRWSPDDAQLPVWWPSVKGESK